MSKTPRIGREETPAERAYLNALWRPEVQLYHGRCLYEAELGKGWKGLAQYSRDTWARRALEMLRVAAEASRDEPPRPPDGGLTLPKEEVA